MNLLSDDFVGFMMAIDPVCEVSKSPIIKHAFYVISACQKIKCYRSL